MNRNPSAITLQQHINVAWYTKCSQTIRPPHSAQRFQRIRENFNVYLLIFLLFTFTLTESKVLSLLEELCIARVKTVIFLARVLNPRRYIYIYIYKDIDTRLTKAWTAIDRLSIIWKSDLTDKMKRSFFQAAVESILLYGCTILTLTKRLEKKLDGNYTRMLRAILNKSWRQHHTRHQLYGHLPPHREKWTRHAGRAHKWWTPMDPHIWPSKSGTISSNIHTAAMWGYEM